jgi:FkbM family methyltransferase
MSSPTDSRTLDGPLLVLNVRGVARIFVPPDLGQTTSYIVLEQEDWFEDEIRFVRRWMRPGMAAADIGASYGLYTLAMARAVGPAGRVWAFEPTPATADCLAQTLALNACSHVALSRVAVSDRVGTVAFSVGAISEQNGVAVAEAGAVRVPATTLDAVAAAQHWDGMDFVKLDVEGHEMEAIGGGRGFFAEQSPLVMFEIKASDQFELGPLALLAEFGYGFYRLLPGLLILVPFDRDQPIDKYQLNMFACKPDRAAQLAAEGVLDDRSARARLHDSDWSGFVATAPYAKELAENWPASAAFFSRSAAKAYRRGLAAFAGSRDASAHASTRCSLLDQAMDYIREASASDDNLAYSASHARLAWEVGHRAEAVDVLLQVNRRLALMPEDKSAWKEPFLAPGTRYEGIATDGRPWEWLRCAAMEQFEKLRSYSSTFSGDSTLELLPGVRELPFCSPEMDRRWQLVRIASGRQASPECAPRLRARSEENLNPEFWCGDRTP